MTRDPTHAPQPDEPAGREGLDGTVDQDREPRVPPSRVEHLPSGGDPPTDSTLEIVTDQEAG